MSDEWSQIKAERDRLLVHNMELKESNLALWKRAETLAAENARLAGECAELRDKVASKDNVIAICDRDYIELRHRAESAESSRDALAGRVAELEERRRRVDAVIIEASHDNIAAMQAAYIAYTEGNHEDAFAWIANTLSGPGLLPDRDAPYGREPQAWFDEHRYKPLPRCACGRPSNTAWHNGKEMVGACCELHYQEARDALRKEPRT